MSTELARQPTVVKGRTAPPARRVVLAARPHWDRKQLPGWVGASSVRDALFERLAALPWLPRTTHEPEALIDIDPLMFVDW